VPFRISHCDPAKQKVENEHVKMAGTRMENTLKRGGAQGLKSNFNCNKVERDHGARRRALLRIIWH
jgi:hypothetical protein